MWPSPTLISNNQIIITPHTAMPEKAVHLFHLTKLSPPTQHKKPAHPLYSPLSSRFLFSHAGL
jgi:hypothetical protein